MRSAFTTAVALAILLTSAFLPGRAEDQGAPSTANEGPTKAASEPTASPPNAGTAATDSRQATAAPATTPAGPPELHRVRMRLAGSMCMACLHTLEDKLRKLQGVDDARIRKQQANYFQTVSPEISTWADSIVIYDEKRLSLINLRAFIRQNGYHSYQVSDKYLDHAPSERDLKL